MNLQVFKLLFPNIISIQVKSKEWSGSVTVMRVCVLGVYAGL